MKTNIQRIRKPATLINIAYFTMLLIGALWISFHYEMSHASSAEYTIKVCQKNFIGYNYNPRVEKKCDLLFRKWTYEILNTYQ